MTPSPKRQAPAGYQLRVAGHLDHHWSPWLGDLTLAHEDDGTTSLTGAVADQAELHGLLTKIRDLGVTLISVAVVNPADGVDHQPDSLDTGGSTTPALVTSEGAETVALESITRATLAEAGGPMSPVEAHHHLA